MEQRDTRGWNSFAFSFTSERYESVVVEDKGDSVTLSGSSYLGRMFGTFTYNATATDGDFNAAYSACKDNGYFRLSKCCN